MKTAGVALGLLLAAGLISPKLRADAGTAGVALDEKNLQPFLSGLGFEPKKVDEAAYTIETKAGSYAITVTAELSSNRRNLWLSAILRFLPDSGPLPANLLEAVLKENNEDFPRFYIATCDACSAGQKRRLKLGVTVPNQNLTPAVVKELVDSLDAVISVTSKVWDASDWPMPAGVSGTK